MIYTGTKLNAITILVVLLFHKSYCTCIGVALPSRSTHSLSHLAGSNPCHNCDGLSVERRQVHQWWVVC